VAVLAGMLAVIAAALVLVVPAASAQAPPHRLTRAEATRLVLRHPTVAGWLRRYQRRRLVTLASFRALRGVWEVKVFSGAAGEVALGTVDDRSGRVLEAWSGPRAIGHATCGPLHASRTRPLRSSTVPSATSPAAPENTLTTQTQIGRAHV